ncbi:hypothetical protein CC030809_00201 [Synechococcus phage S-CAM7]|uniref:Uncharacterized protein n=1 Tax=Synechococcus phage S-CAM7 TaxID=1883368 RepID=A0A7D5JH30_9CAUD|nr:hypothetical protein CC030809_00201 [Synechococcus phage S-CAM7]
MEFQITEAIELVKTLAETENLTHTEALTAFFYEADMSIEDAAMLKAAFFESYTLQEMAVDSLTNALHNVFVGGLSEESEELSEVDTKETGEGTKYKVRVKDRASNSSYVRYATREKIAELRANPNISSVELTDHGTTGEDDRGERTSAAKRGDRDGDGKVESGSKEHAGVVHNAIQRKTGGTPDGQDTRKEEFELDEAEKRIKSGKRYHDGKRKMSDEGGPAKIVDPKKMHSEDYELEEGKKEADLGKMRRQSNKHMKDAVGKRTKSDSDSKNKSFKMDGIRRSIERGEDPRRDTYGGKRTGKDGTHPPEDHRSNFSYNMKDRPAKEPGVKKESAWDAYLELRENRRAARAAGGYKDDSKKQTDPSKEGFTGISNSIADIMKQNKEIEAKKKKRVAEDFLPEAGKSDAGVRSRMKISGYEPPTNWDPEANQGKGATVSAKQSEKRRRKALRKEDFLPEADLVDAGRENQSQRDKKKLTGKGVDNKSNIKLMPSINETVVTEHPSKSLDSVSAEANVNESIRAKIQEMGRLDEECCPKCGTPECVCEGKKEEKPKKKKAKIDESGMPILEYSRNNARPGPSPEMINPGKDPEGDVGHMNPKGKPKRYKNKGEAPGDRRPNDPSGPDLPLEKGVVPNGSGV